MFIAKMLMLFSLSLSLYAVDDIITYNQFNQGRSTYKINCEKSGGVFSEKVFGYLDDELVREAKLDQEEMTNCYAIAGIRTLEPSIDFNLPNETRHTHHISRRGLCEVALDGHPLVSGGCPILLALALKDLHLKENVPLSPKGQVAIRGSYKIDVDRFIFLRDFFESARMGRIEIGSDAFRQEIQRRFTLSASGDEEINPVIKSLEKDLKKQLALFPEDAITEDDLIVSHYFKLLKENDPEFLRNKSAQLKGTIHPFNTYDWPLSVFGINSEMGPIAKRMEDVWKKAPRTSFALSVKNHAVALQQMRILQCSGQDTLYYFYVQNSYGGDYNGYIHGGEIFKQGVDLSYNLPCGDENSYRGKCQDGVVILGVEDKLKKIALELDILARGNFIDPSLFLKRWDQILKDPSLTVDDLENIFDFKVDSESSAVFPSIFSLLIDAGDETNKNFQSFFNSTPLQLKNFLLNKIFSFDVFASKLISNARILDHMQPFLDFALNNLSANNKGKLEKTVLIYGNKFQIENYYGKPFTYLTPGLAYSIILYNRDSQIITDFFIQNDLNFINKEAVKVLFANHNIEQVFEEIEKHPSGKEKVALIKSAIESSMQENDQFVEDLLRKNNLSNLKYVLNNFEKNIREKHFLKKEQTIFDELYKEKVWNESALKMLFEFGPKNIAAIISLKLSKSTAEALRRLEIGKFHSRQHDGRLQSPPSKKTRYDNTFNEINSLKSTQLELL